MTADDPSEVRQARKMLKSPGPGQPGRTPAVFPAPPLCALEASNYEYALHRAWAPRSTICGTPSTRRAARKTLGRGSLKCIQR